MLPPHQKQQPKPKESGTGIKALREYQPHNGSSAVFDRKIVHILLYSVDLTPVSTILDFEVSIHYEITILIVILASYALKLQKIKELNIFLCQDGEKSHYLM